MTGGIRTTSRPVRVLVVDDSALMRKFIPELLAGDPAIEVAGTAMDGAFALRKIEELKPDVVTLDLEMPRMSGIETLREIMRRRRLPVIVVSAHSTEGATATLNALALGAVDFIAKPENVTAGMGEIAADLVRKIKAAAQIESPPALRLPDAVRAASPRRPRPDASRRPDRVVAIAASTGGPNALQFVLAQLPADLPAALLVVQHMPEGFTEMFARRLNETCALEVKEAQSGDLLLAGRVLVCPGNRHLRVRRMSLGDVVALGDDLKIGGHRPSANALFQSVAETFGPRAMAVLLTGMGEDGAEGMGAVKTAGGLTIAQDEKSCVVYGMPKAAIERGFAARVVPLEAMANAIIAQCLPVARAANE
ncbi:MAG TPA: chemotaxis response regulator protein-glutamate methylesterase [Terriglobales bacterium]|nr:chemotaxis response regulator protein-glutamate methylesterase [Terriglobales bacterium]